MPSINTLFEDVYDKMPETLKESQRDLETHLENNKDKYDLSKYN